MAKVCKVTNVPEERYLFECPGCGCAHIFQVPLWRWNGDADKPTVTGSVLVNADIKQAAPGAHRCHLFIKEGKIEYLSDCTHKLAGQTVEIIDI